MNNINNIPTLKSWKLIKDKNSSRFDNIALSEDSKMITYGEMFDNWDNTAKAFSALNITRKNNSRVLVLMPNVANTCNIDYALDMTGAVCDFIDPTTCFDKIKDYIKNEKITDIISLDLLYEQNIGKKTEELKKEYGIKNIVLYSDYFMNSFLPANIRLYGKLKNHLNKFSREVIRIEDAIKNSKYESICYDSSSDKDLSLITHTSGTTTGIGKPIPLTDYNRNALVTQYEMADFNYQPGMKMMHFIPYFAGYGAVNTAHLGLCEGLELQQIPLFSPDKFGELLEKYKPNIVLANTPCWLNLIKNPKFQNIDLSFLVYASSGGTPTSEEDEILINNFLKKHNAKVLLTKGYGLSELGGCCITTIDNYNEIGSVGVPLPLTDIRIRNVKTGEIKKIGNEDLEGEALIHTETMTSGVLDGKKVVNIENIDGKDFIATKDVLKILKNGITTYIERIDRMFPRYDAYNVYPMHIENLLKSYEEIKNCVIVPIFDKEKNGYVPKVYIQLSTEVDNKEEFINQIINDSFINNIKKSNYKANFRDIPRCWNFVDDIPKNTMGKEDYHKLKNDDLDGEKYDVIVEEDNIGVKNIEIKKETEKVLKIK